MKAGIATMSRSAALMTLAMMAGLALFGGHGLADAYELEPWAGTLPANAVRAGDDGGEPLFVCVVAGWGGQHPGVLDNLGVCRVAWGGQEHQFDDDFLVLVDSGDGSWETVAAGEVPDGAFRAGGDDSGALYVCRAGVGGALVPGKLTAEGWCYVARNGEELYFTKDYEVLLE